MRKSSRELVALFTDRPGTTTRDGRFTYWKLSVRQSEWLARTLDHENATGVSPLTNDARQRFMVRARRHDLPRTAQSWCDRMREAFVTPRGDLGVSQYWTGAPIVLVLARDDADAIGALDAEIAARRGVPCNLDEVPLF